MTEAEQIKHPLSPDRASKRVAMMVVINFEDWQTWEREGERSLGPMGPAIWVLLVIAESQCTGGHNDLSRGESKTMLLSLHYQIRTSFMRDEFYPRGAEQEAHKWAVAGNMSDHSIYLRVSVVYIHESTQRLLPGR